MVDTPTNNIYISLYIYISKITTFTNRFLQTYTEGDIYEQSQVDTKMHTYSNRQEDTQTDTNPHIFTNTHILAQNFINQQVKTCQNEKFGIKIYFVINI